MMTPASRLLAGGVLAAAIAFGAMRTRSLSASGAAAATMSGAFASAAGWDWATLLVVFFVSTATFSRLGSAGKAARTGGIVAKGGPRDWRQVVANGGVFTAAALLSLASPTATVAVMGAGSLAAAAADSWATEIGTWKHTLPRSILTLRPVPTGTSGGVSAVGTLGMLAGAALMGGVALALGWTPAAAAAVAAGGVAGAVVDSLLGAAVQSRRWCPSCATATERAIHSCGTVTTRAGGLSWLDNDAVNLACAASGGLLAALLAA